MKQTCREEWPRSRPKNSKEHQVYQVRKDATQAQNTIIKSQTPVNRTGQSILGVATQSRSELRNYKPTKPNVTPLIHALPHENIRK